MSELMIFLDLDDVLVDFVGSALEIHGVDRLDFEEMRPHKTWSIQETLQITDDEFWEPIDNKGDEFWLQLIPLPWMDHLLDVIENRIKIPYHILTSPSNHHTSYSGKAAWMSCMFGEKFEEFTITKHKHYFAKKNAILIDDREKNVTQFQAHGGKGIIFPSKGNQLHEQSERPLQHVFHELEKIKEEWERTHALKIWQH